MIRKKIGILGGMGTLSTIHTYDALFRKFKIKKEWDFPETYIINNSQLPSRVRAILYNEKKDELINGLYKGINKLEKLGANYIILPCNTAHYFLKDYKSKTFINMISTFNEYLISKKINEIYVIGSEGTIDSKLYDFYLNKNINITYPKKHIFTKLRYFIENVKQNNINKKLLDDFGEFLESIDYNNIVMGCTEFSLLYDKLNQKKFIIENKNIFDPLDITINKLIGKIKIHIS